MGIARKLQNRAKKAIIGVVSRPLISEGFTNRAARLWTREVLRDRRSTDQRGKEDRAAHTAGFTRQTYTLVRQLDGEEVISQRDFRFLSPMNTRRSWLLNRVIANRAIPGLIARTPRQFCSVFTGPRGFDIVRFRDYPSDLPAAASGLLDLIRREGSVSVVPLRWDRGVGRVVQWDGQEFTVDGWPTTNEAVLGMLADMTTRRRCVLAAHSVAPEYTGSLVGANDAVVRMYVGKSADGAEAQVLDAELAIDDSWRPATPTLSEVHDARASRSVRRGWEKRRQRLRFGEQRFAVVEEIELVTERFSGLAECVGEVERVLSADHLRFRFIVVDVALTGDGGFTVVDFSMHPRYPKGRLFSPAANEFLRAQLSERRKRVEEQQKSQPNAFQQLERRRRRLRRRSRSFHLRSAGFTGRMARSWVRRLEEDKRRDDRFSGEKREQAHRWGFLPATVENFGIDSDNVDSFVSERDYSFVHPLNGKYGKWVRDRISAHTVFEPFQESFEPTHFHVLRRDKDLQIIPLSDEAKAFPASVDGIAAFIEEHSPLTLVSSAWSGGTHLEIGYSEHEFTVGDASYSRDEFEKLLTYRVRDQFYVLIEPVHTEALEGLSDLAETDLRIIMINPDGTDPRAAEATLVFTEELPRGILNRGGKQSLQTSTLSIDGVSEAEAELARAEHREDIGGPRSEDDSDDIRVESEDAFEDEDDRSDELERVSFVCRVSLRDGSFRGARAIVDGRLVRYAKHPATGERIAGVIPKWSETVERLVEMCRFTPQLEFVEFAVAPGSETICITGIAAMPPYSAHFPFSRTTTAFLRERIDRKRERTHQGTVRSAKWLRNAKLKARKQFAAALYPEGLVPYQSVRWLGDIRRDLMQRNGISLQTKLWAYRNGFLSYRIPQYGITPENRTQFISDLEYRWLRHINKKYKYWLEDKISIKYVAAEFNECLPAYYFYTSQQGGANHVVPMMDCPNGYEPSFPEILRLARELGTLALKPDEGSHGEGFYRLTYESGAYSLNGVPATEESVLAILNNPENQYLITEFIEMHPEIAKMYPHSVNTIRMIVFKKDGVTPEIGNAYLRVGSLKSGFVDNTAAGGMLAEIDPETGEFGNAQWLEKGRVEACRVHPDTGVLIEGVIPDWERAKQQVLAIAESLPQLEYLGFDVAITEHGIKLPEINRFPDYPRIDRLTPATIDYLLFKLEQKKRLYGYDVKPPRSLIKLPDRTA